MLAYQRVTIEIVDLPNKNERFSIAFCQRLPEDIHLTSTLMWILFFFWGQEKLGQG